LLHVLPHLPPALAAILEDTAAAAAYRQDNSASGDTSWLLCWQHPIPTGIHVWDWPQPAGGWDGDIGRKILATAYIDYM